MPINVLSTLNTFVVLNVFATPEVAFRLKPNLSVTRVCTWIPPEIHVPIRSLVRWYTAFFWATVAFICTCCYSKFYLR